MNIRFPEGYISYVKEWEAKINAFISLNIEEAEKREVSSCTSPDIPPEATALIAGLPFAVKDNIAVKGQLLTCGSKLLEHFRSSYSATVVQKLEKVGGIVIGKTNLDEFGMGSSTDNSALQQTNNPWDFARVSGGSSGGSAATVASGIVPYALGTDTGGSVRQPSSFCGVVGLKPTYGAISRYGLVAYASSFDTAGVIADTVARCRAVFASIRGKDPLDQTSHDAPEAAPHLYPSTTSNSPPSTPKKIGVLSPETMIKALFDVVKNSKNGGIKETETYASIVEEEVRRSFELAKERLSTLGHSLVEVEIPGLEYGAPAYFTISAAEASANLARFDGIRYGARPAQAENPDALASKARGAGFGPKVKMRILLGTFVLRSDFQDRYFARAKRICQSIKAGFEALLGDGEYKNPAKLDAILMPVFPTRAFCHGPSLLSDFADKASDLYTCCANLAGLPALSFPASLEGGLPVGVQLMGRAYAEATLLDIAEGYERQFPFPHPDGFKAFWR